MLFAMIVSAGQRWFASSWSLLLMLALVLQLGMTQDSIILPGDGEQRTLGQSAFLGARRGGELAWGEASSSSEPVARTAGRMVAMGDVMYIFGGLRYGAGSGGATVPLPLADLWSYNLSSSSWTNLSWVPGAPTPRYAHSMASVGQRLVVCAGKGYAKEDVPDVEMLGGTYMLDATSRPPRWADISYYENSPGPHFGFSLVSVGTELWLLGDNLQQATMLPHVLSPRPGWRKVSGIRSPPSSRFNFATSSIGKRIFMSGGVLASDATAAATGVYELDTGAPQLAWRDLSSASIPPAMGFHPVLASIDQRLYMLVGMLSAAVQNGTWTRQLMYLDVGADGPPAWTNSSFAASDLWSNLAYGVAASTEGGEGRPGRLVVVGSFDGATLTVFTASALNSTRGGGSPACVRGTWWDATFMGDSGTCQACKPALVGGGCPLGHHRVECSALQTSMCDICPAPENDDHAFLSRDSCLATECSSGVPNAIRGSCVIGTPSWTEPVMLDVVQMQSRANHAVARLDRIGGIDLVVSGGLDSDGKTAGEAYSGKFLLPVYVLRLRTFASPSWIRLATLNSTPEARAFHGMASEAGQIYLYGGMSSGGGYLGDLASLDVDGDQALWTTLTFPDAPRARARHSMVTAGSRIWVFGGNVEGGGLEGGLWALYTPAKKWVSFGGLAGEPSPRHSHAAATWEDKMYIFGGIGPSSPFSDMHALDCSSPFPSWSLISAGGGPGARVGHAMVAAGGLLWMNGGSIDGDDKAVYSMDVSVGGGVWADAVIPDFKERSPGGGVVEVASSGKESLPSSSHTMTEAWGGIFIFGGLGASSSRAASLLSPIALSPPPCLSASAYWDGETPSCTTCGVGNCSEGQMAKACSLTEDTRCMDCDSSLLLEGEVWTSSVNCSRALCRAGWEPNMQRLACIETSSSTGFLVALLTSIFGSICFCMLACSGIRVYLHRKNRRKHKDSDQWDDYEIRMGPGGDIHTVWMKSTGNRPKVPLSGICPNPESDDNCGWNFRTSSELDDWERPDWNFESSLALKILQEEEASEKTSGDGCIEGAGVGLIMPSFATQGDPEVETSGGCKTVAKLQPFQDYVVVPLPRKNSGRGLNGTVPVSDIFEEKEPHLKRSLEEVESTLTKSHEDDEALVREQGKMENIGQGVESSRNDEVEDCGERRRCDNESDAVDEGLEHGIKQDGCAEPSVVAACPAPPPALDHPASTNASVEEGPGKEMVKPQGEGPGKEMMKPRGERMGGEEEPSVDAHGSGEEELCNGEAELQIHNGEEGPCGGEAELCNGEEEICNGEAELCNGEEELCNGEEELCNGEEELCNGEAELCNGEEELCNGEEEPCNGEEELRAHAERLMNVLGERVEKIMKVLGDRFEQDDDGSRWGEEECVSPRVSIPTTSAMRSGPGPSRGALMLEVAGAEECQVAFDRGGKVRADGGGAEAVDGGIEFLDGGVETTGVDGGSKAIDSGRMVNADGAFVCVDTGTALSSIGAKNGDGGVELGGGD